MKKLILLLALALVMCGCTTGPSYEETKKTVEQNQEQEIWHGFHVVVIDSCEYIIRADINTKGYRGYGFGFMSHKGNCKFCAERRKKEREELIKALTK